MPLAKKFMSVHTNAPCNHITHENYKIGQPISRFPAQVIGKILNGPSFVIKRFILQCTFIVLCLTTALHFTSAVSPQLLFEAE